MESKPKFLVFSTIAILLVGFVSVFSFCYFSRILGFLWSMYPVHLDIAPSKGNFDVWNFLFFFLMLLGLIRFVLYKETDIRLLGFCYAILLFESCLGILDAFLHTFHTIFATESGSFGGLYFVIRLGFNIAYAWISYQVLSMLMSNHPVKATCIEGYTFYDEVSTTKRLCHFVIDTLIAILIFSPFLFTSLFFYFEKSVFFQTYLNNKHFAAFLFVVFRFVYYFFFESLFGKTPAKFLTDSRVVGNGVSLSRSRIAVRTLCRSIPFDSLSFVLVLRGWHDSLSKTIVVKDEPPGERLNYLLIFLFVFFVLLIYYFR